MLNISERLFMYIDTQYNDIRKAYIYKAFKLLEEFGVNDYETPFMVYIDDEDITPEARQDLVNSLLTKLLVMISEEHQIYINRKHDVDLREMLEIVGFLFFIQRREDYHDVSRILYSDIEDEEKVYLLIEEHSMLSDKELRDVIDYVGEGLVKAMQEMVKGKVEAAEIKADEKHVRYVNQFRAFIDDHLCLGLTLYDKGYTKTTLTELMDIVTFDMREHVDKLFALHPEEVALDILSLLIITRDRYDMPLLKLDKHLNLFFDHIDHITKIKTIVTRILTDFVSYLEGTEQLEKDHGNKP